MSVTSANTSYIEPLSPVTYEEKIKRSIFIANLSLCHNEEEARNFLNRITSQHRDATHNCRAYILNSGNEYFSDDGEPSGTAGRPILNAIKRSSLVNVMVIVTRYFGGVKLGTRGLIDAYGGTASKALEMAGKVECLRTETLSMLLEYNAIGLVTRLLESHGAVNIVWNYGEHVKVVCDVPIDEYDNLKGEIEELKLRKLIRTLETKSL